MRCWNWRPGVARDALHFAALFDRFIQNLRRYVGYDGLAGGGHPSFLHESQSGHVKGGSS